MPVLELTEFLDRENVKYITLTHSTAYTSQEIAALTHIPGRELAKTVVVKLDDDLALAVLPASYQVDISALKAETGAANATLAKEADFKNRFPGCETGAMPPFGNLYGMKTYVDESLTRDKDIAFNAGSHKELVRLPYADFERLANATVLRFAATPGVRAA